jgi:hypothetical protein
MSAYGAKASFEVAGDHGLEAAWAINDQGRGLLLCRIPKHRSGSKSRDDLSRTRQASFSELLRAASAGL